MRYLLDTNICIALMRKQPTVVQRLAAAAPNECSISTVTSYELHTGIAKCRDPIREQVELPPIT